MALVVCSLTACGVVGSPIPPEHVGVAVTIEEQKRQDALNGRQPPVSDVDPTQSDPEFQGQDVNLPSLHPVGTR